MRSDSIRKVEQVLLKADKGVSVQYIRAHADLSYSTVKRALDELGATQVSGTWPVEWTIERQLATMPDIRRGSDEQTVLVPLREIDTLPSMWNRSAANVTEKLAAVKLNEKTPLPETIETFRNAAELFASITYQLEQVADKPDWLTELGTEPEQFTEQTS